MSINVALVHGYTGAHTDLQPLADGLAADPAVDKVLNISLPGHGGHEPPRFEEEVLVNHIRNSVDSLQKDDGKTVWIGHSTGGCLLVSALRKTGIAPDLLILINVPHRIDMDYLKRWGKHRGSSGKPLLARQHRFVGQRLPTSAGPSSYRLGR